MDLVVLQFSFNVSLDIHYNINNLLIQTTFNEEFGIK